MGDSFKEFEAAAEREGMTLEAWLIEAARYWAHRNDRRLRRCVACKVESIAAPGETCRMQRDTKNASPMCGGVLA